MGEKGKIGIKYTSRFVDSYKKLELKLMLDFDHKLEIFQSDPFYNSLHTHLLKGSLQNYYSFYLIKGYRVIFRFVNKDTVVLMDIGNHKMQIYLILLYNFFALTLVTLT